MKVVFVTNYFNHHQQPFADELYDILGEEYCFIETATINQKRLDMGWDPTKTRPYVKKNFTDEVAREECQRIIDESEVVIHGGAPYSVIENRLKSGRLTFKYTERIYKNGCPYHKLPSHFISNYKKYIRYKNFYLLCASAYTSADFAKTFTFKNKAYKWGYFTELKNYESIDGLFEEKRKNEPISLLWAGRLIDLKHPEYAVNAAKRLAEDGYDFVLNIIGNGVMEKELSELIESDSLQERVHMLGPMPPETVREYMDKANIYLFTSDNGEGWGAVLNESMNSGCAVIANHAIGSAPFLIEHGENGFLYKNGDFESFYSTLKKLMNSRELCEKTGRAAYASVSELWNARTAAQRFLKLADELQVHGKCDLFDIGPCSRAPSLSDGWFKA